jgi:hypothetical protein
MPLTFYEVPESRKVSAVPPSATLKYKASGEQNESIVAAFAEAATGSIYASPFGLLYRQDIQLEPDGANQYWVTIPYAQKKKESGQWTFTFDTTGATVKLKCARQHIHTYWAPGTVSTPTNPHKGMIGAKGSDGDVEGVDITVPALKINVQFRHPQGVITMAQVKALASATGYTNLNPYLSHNPGELLFLGATGQDGSNTETEVAYQFASSANSTLNFETISGIAKKGFEVLWAESKPGIDSGHPSTQLIAIHIERVYDPIDFASVFGWS